jgi:hypothetical protein
MNAFAITHNHFRQLQANVIQRGLKRRQITVGRGC